MSECQRTPLGCRPACVRGCATGLCPGGVGACAAAPWMKCLVAPHPGPLPGWWCPDLELVPPAWFAVPRLSASASLAAGASGEDWLGPMCPVLFGWCAGSFPSLFLDWVVPGSSPVLGAGSLACWALVGVGLLCAWPCRVGPVCAGCSGTLPSGGPSLPDLSSSKETR